MKITLSEEDLISIGRQLEEKLEVGIDNMLDDDLIYEAIDLKFMQDIGTTVGRALSETVSKAILEKLQDPVYIQKIVDKRMSKFISL